MKSESEKKKAGQKAKRSRRAAAPPRQLADTPGARRARFNRMIAKAKARGEKIPAGVKLIAFRDPTPAEREYGKKLEPLARAAWRATKRAARQLNARSLKT